MTRPGLPLVALLALASLPARAQNLVLTHQGYLLDAQDKPVTGTVAVTVRLWNDRAADNAQAKLWEDTFGAVQVEHGFYTLALGDTLAAGHEDKQLPGAAFTSDVYLSVSIGSAELLPRLRIGMVPGAANAKEALHAAKADGATQADDAKTLGGVAAAQYALKSDVPAQAADSAKLGGHAPDFYLTTTGQAADAAKLGGHTPEFYLAATAQAADSAKFGGQLPSAFLAADGKAVDAAKLGGQLPSAYLAAGAQAADSAKLNGLDPSAYLRANGQAADSAKLGGVAASALLDSTGKILPTALPASALVPPGSVVAFAGTTAPAGWFLCDGAAVSRTTYSALFSVIGISHGGGDGVNTFNLPDYRGRFLRGVDGGAGNDPDKTARVAMAAGGNSGNAVGSVQGSQLTSHAHHTHMACAAWNYTGGSNNCFLSVYGYGNTNSYFNDSNDMTTQASGGNETRPVNANVNYLIKL